MNSIFETQRQTHEEIERYEQALAEVLLQAPTAVSFASTFVPTGYFADAQQRNITRRDRKAAEILDRIVALRESLVRQYEDGPGCVLRVVPRMPNLRQVAAIGTGGFDGATWGQGTRR